MLPIKDFTSKKRSLQDNVPASKRVHRDSEMSASGKEGNPGAKKHSRIYKNTKRSHRTISDDGSKGTNDDPSSSTRAKRSANSLSQIESIPEQTKCTRNQINTKQLQKGSDQSTADVASLPARSSSLTEDSRTSTNGNMPEPGPQMQKLSSKGLEVISTTVLTSTAQGGSLRSNSAEFLQRGKLSNKSLVSTVVGEENADVRICSSNLSTPEPMHTNEDASTSQNTSRAIKPTDCISKNVYLVRDEPMSMAREKYNNEFLVTSDELRNKLTQIISIYIYPEVGTTGDTISKSRINRWNDSKYSAHVMDFLMSEITKKLEATNLESSPMESKPTSRIEESQIDEMMCPESPESLRNARIAQLCSNAIVKHL